MDHHLAVIDLVVGREVSRDFRHGGALVYIDALHRLKDQLEEPWMQHSSEQLAINYGKGLLPDNTFDFIIANNGSLSSLEKKTLALAVKIGPYVNT